MHSGKETKKQTVFKEEREKVLKEQEKKTIDMDRNVAGFLCYLVWFITGIIFLVLEKENRFIRFHALQSIVVSVILLILNTVLMIIPILGWILAALLSPVYIILWIVLMWKAYSGEYFKLPIVGDIAERQVDKI